MLSRSGFTVVNYNSLSFLDFVPLERDISYVNSARIHIRILRNLSLKRCGIILGYTSCVYGKANTNNVESKKEKSS